MGVLNVYCPLTCTILYFILLSSCCHPAVRPSPHPRSGESGIHDDSGNCVFNPNVPYALFSSFMTFWCPVIVMVIVYYRVFRYRVKYRVFWYKQTNKQTKTHLAKLPSPATLSHTLGKKS